MSHTRSPSLATVIDTMPLKYHRESLLKTIPPPLSPLQTLVPEINKNNYCKIKILPEIDNINLKITLTAKYLCYLSVYNMWPLLNIFL